MLARRALAAATRCASVRDAAQRAALSPRPLPQSWAPLKRGCAAAAAAAAPQPPQAGLAHWAAVYSQLSKFRLRRAPGCPCPQLARAARPTARGRVRLAPRGAEGFLLRGDARSGFVVSTACAGYALGSADELQWAGMAWTAAGTWGAAACANALNQVRTR
jgi:hypothetical protein